MRWSLEAWMKHWENSFSWNIVHKHSIIWYIWMCLYVPISSYHVHCVLHLCYPMLYLRRWYSCKHRNSKELVSISYLGDALLCITKPIFLAQFFFINLRCSFQITFSSNNTPRNFMDSSFFILRLLIVKFGNWRWILSFLLGLWKKRVLGFFNIHWKFVSYKPFI